MLVLTRKYQEKIHIGDGITITVLHTKGKAVRLGIEAPAEVPVIRGELAFSKSPGESVATVTGAIKSDGTERDRRARQPKRKPARDQSTATWRIESHEDKAAPQVSLDRVSRSKEAQILPSLLASTAPLRHMLQNRSRSM
jgi:carbon storage regulator